MSYMAKKTTKSIIPAARIQQAILMIRNKTVMLDSDLAVLYEEKVSG